MELYFDFSFREMTSFDENIEKERMNIMSIYPKKTYRNKKNI